MEITQPGVKVQAKGRAAWDRVEVLALRLLRLHSFIGQSTGQWQGKKLRFGIVPYRSDHAMSVCYHRFSANRIVFPPYRNNFAAKITALRFRSFEPTHDF